MVLQHCWKVTRNHPRNNLVFCGGQKNDYYAAARCKTKSLEA